MDCPGLVIGGEIAMTVPLEAPITEERFTGELRVGVLT